MDDHRWREHSSQRDRLTGMRQDGRSPCYPSVQDTNGTGEYISAERHEADEVKDWQKACWKGPKPPMLNPFDEPTTAPELKEERSDNLYDRSGDFWQGRTMGYPGAQYDRSYGDAAKASAEKKRGDRSGALRAILITLVVLVLAVAALYFFVFRIRNITVMGNKNVSDEEIIRISGIGPGSDILSLTQEAVATKINNDYRLHFMYLEKQLPDGVILCVREREPVSCFTFCGILYIMDKHRVILNETEHDQSLANGLIRVEGMDIRGGCAVGQTLVLNSRAQEEVYDSLIVELKVIDCLDQVREINLTDTNSIMLTILSGAPQDGTGRDEATFTVVLGNAENLHAKLRAMMLVRQEVAQMGYREGTINVSTPAQTVFSP